MARHVWPEDTLFTRLELEPQDRACACCGRRMKLCDHRHRRFFSLQGPIHLVCKLAHCGDELCPGHHYTVSPEEEIGIALPRSLIAWDVLAWIGHRRFARHWSVGTLRCELLDSYAINLSADTIEDSIQRYQILVAARQADPLVLAQEYAGVEDVLLAIDGLQPEKGHETLYVVRELRRQRVWFAESLLSSSAAEVQRLLVGAKEWAERLGKPVRGWTSDKQDAFLTGIAEVFPGVPHRLCHNHFLRGLAKPMLEKDSHAKVNMRSKVRGLRDLERQALSSSGKASAPGTKAACICAVAAAAGPGPATAVTEVPPREAAAEAPAAEAAVVPTPAAQTPMAVAPATPESPAVPAGQASGADVVLDYCTVVRGILNDDQGGPLHPPGVRMAEALQEVRASLERNLGGKKGGAPRSS
jgi:hypothetical protein